MLTKLYFKPGINRENTNYATEGGWYDMDKVRFRFGTPEKIGGWKSAVSGTYQGVARNIISWATLQGEVLLGIGTHLRYYINYGSTYHNITPLRTTTTLTNPFITTINSSVVKVVAALHGVSAGDIIIFSNATTTGGINASTFNNTLGYKTLSIIDANTYTVDVGTLATANAQGGGTVTAEYEIAAGLPVYSTGSGWGAGYWSGPFTGTASTTLSGSGRVALNSSDTTINVESVSGFSTTGALVIDSEIITYTGLSGNSFTGCVRGTQGSMAAAHHRRQLSETTFAPIAVKQVIGYSGTTGWGAAADSSLGVGFQMRLWSSASFGQDLIFSPRGAGLYYWTKDITAFTRGAALRDAAHATKKFVPHTLNYVMVSDVSRFIMALGANPYDPANATSTFDPMLVRWSAQNDPTNWVPAATNQAGELRLSSGSYLMAGVNMKQEILLWTDTSLYSFQYIGPPYVWRSELSMANLSLMGPNAVAVVNNNAYWMGTDKFYIYSGRVDTLQCTIQQYIFNDISFSQRFQTFAGTNEGFNEIWWFYVSNTEVVNATQQGRDPTVDKYAVYNHSEQCWYYGTLNRTAWVDTALYPGPLACTGNSTSGTLVMHEQGTDDGTTDTLLPITAYIQSSDIDIGDGHQFVFVWRMLPDVSFNGSVVPNPYATVTLIPRQNQGAAYGTGDPTTVQSTQIYSQVVKQYTVQQFTQQIDTRVRGRALSFRIESNTLGVQWKLGNPRIDARPDGRKS
jgi:hypothetical protein